MKNKNFIKKDPLYNILKNSLMDLPTPRSISFLWNIGFLLGICLLCQIITGITLSINYVPYVEIRFQRVIHIIRDVENGWTIRYIHINGASLFFMLIYIHMARGIYFNRPMKLPIVWRSGVIILLISIGTAFIGYVLPWGQISFWGATVITSIISAIPYIGTSITQWLWGNFSVSQPTLNRFLSLHFVLPFVILGIVIIHLLILHQTGSSNPTGVNPDYEKIKFFPFFLIKDTGPLVVCIIIIITIISLSPNYLGDVENFNKARITSTPPHIQPEWYFLFAYAILRCIPSKLGGVLAMVISILIILTLCFKKHSINKKFSPLKKLTYWVFVSDVCILTWIGANPVEQPFSFLGEIRTILYFSIFLIL